VKIEPSETQIMLTDMLTENTGRHMLDSGGAYGRNWERNQGSTVEDFINSPVVHVDRYSGPIVSVFHYLDAHLEYDKELDDEFQEWINQPEREDETYFSCVYEWCAKEDDNEYIFGGLTYNTENNLSQDFQADTFSRDGEDYVCLSIHGGCDIRGGYTKPRIFKAYEYFMHNLDSFTLYANENTGRKAKSVTLDWRGGELYHVETDECLGGYLHHFSLCFAVFGPKIVSSSLSIYLVSALDVGHKLVVFFLFVVSVEKAVFTLWCDSFDWNSVF
jgi:hypothetical protein